VIELADEAIIEELRGLTPEERLARAANIAVTRRRAIRAELELLHPGWGDEQLRYETSRRYYSHFG